MTTKPTNREGADRYTVDFEATTGTTNRWATNNTGEDVRYPSRRTADRRLLTYTSLPLPDDIEITGQPRVALNVGSTHSDGAFFVYLEDVAPDGTVRYLTEAELRALHRKVSNEDPPYRVVGPYHSFKQKDALPLVPGQIAEIGFELMPVSVPFVPAIVCALLLRAPMRIRSAASRMRASQQLRSTIAPRIPRVSSCLS